MRTDKEFYEAAAKQARKERKSILGRLFGKVIRFFDNNLEGWFHEVLTFIKFCLFIFCACIPIFGWLVLLLWAILRTLNAILARLNAITELTINK